MIQLTFKTKQKEETKNFGKPYVSFYVIISTILKTLNKTNTAGKEKKKVFFAEKQSQYGL